MNRSKAELMSTIKIILNTNNRNEVEPGVVNKAG
jgi:hypothetical protein